MREEIYIISSYYPNQFFLYVYEEVFNGETYVLAGSFQPIEKFAVSAYDKLEDYEKEALLAQFRDDEFGSNPHIECYEIFASNEWDFVDADRRRARVVVGLRAELMD